LVLSRTRTGKKPPSIAKSPKTSVKAENGAPKGGKAKKANDTSLTNVGVPLERVKSRSTLRNADGEVDRFWTRESSQAVGPTYQIPEGDEINSTASLIENGNGTEVVRWVRSRKNSVSTEALIAAIDGALAKHKPAKLIKCKTRGKVNSNQATFYFIPDIHHSLKYNKDETGHTYGLAESTQCITAATGRLVQNSPDTEDCVIVNLGDFVHVFNSTFRTRSGHILQADGSFHEIMVSACQLLIHCVELCLQKHPGRLWLYNVQGNHSPGSATFMLIESCKQYFRDNLRVHVVDTANSIQTFRAGNNFYVFYHGDCGLNPQKLYNIVSSRYPKDFAECINTNVHILIGHIHSERLVAIANGARVERLGSPVKPDKFSADGFAGGQRYLTSVTADYEDGEVFPTRVNIKPDIDVDPPDNAIVVKPKTLVKTKHTRNKRAKKTLH
jgi:hypothetical protein